MMVKIKFVLRARVLAFPVGRLQLNSVVVVCIGLQFCISVEVSLNHVGLSKRESITKITPIFEIFHLDSHLQCVAIKFAISLSVLGELV